MALEGPCGQNSLLLIVAFAMLTSCHAFSPVGPDMTVLFLNVVFRCRRMYFRGVRPTCVVRCSVAIVLSPLYALRIFVRTTTYHNACRNSYQIAMFRWHHFSDRFPFCPCLLFSLLALHSLT